MWHNVFMFIRRFKIPKYKVFVLMWDEAIIYVEADNEAEAKELALEAREKDFSFVDAGRDVEEVELEEEEYEDE